MYPSSPIPPRIRTERRSWRHHMVFFVLLSGCESEPEAGIERGVERVPARVEAIAFDRERTRLEAVGTSRALHSVVLYPAAAGEVVAVEFRADQLVVKDQVLLELDARSERLAVELAEVRLQDAERLYDRYRRAEGTAAVLPTELDTARLAVEAARIELGRARVALDDRTVAAPFAGYVGITDIDAGDRIGPETAITTLDDRSLLLVSFAAPEVLVGRLGVGAQVQVTTWGRPDHVVTGIVVDVDSRIDPSTRTYVTRAHVLNEADELRPGMSFRVIVDLAGAQFPVVPEIAVQWGADGAYLWLAEEGVARRMPVNVVQRQQGRVLVEGDLAPGDMIVVEGVQRMREGVVLNISAPVLAHPAGAVPGDDIGEPADD